ncbi:MAG: glutamate--cysteine ligase [Neptunomonas phycophila]|uniref:glutamate--cysteine ligase n=1 Tax=Neptunomonas phycophila TaxID=1572645 RepID=UPI003B8BDFA8
MTSVLEQQLDQLNSQGTAQYLKGILHGIEKEGLRVDHQGYLSQSSHPASLGAALTNPYITTDYSEALLEFITPVLAEPDAAIEFLDDLHTYSYRGLGDELIWAGSMPCTIPKTEDIPIAEFGSSNVGQMKHIYRVGLEHRYGKMMQTIAGIHYNFSLPDDFWQAYQAQEGNSDSLQAFRSASYFKLIRNFRRYSWLLLYLFGASPALSSSFLTGRTHELQQHKEQTLYLPYATSLRMSDLGYSNKAQSSLNICFNHLHTYTRSLHSAIHTPYSAYEKIGVKVDGNYRQLNSNILQIENEYYSDIRPKRVTRSGEKPLHALQERGVEYIEVRNTDINPLLPSGIDSSQAHFLDAFLITCLLMSDKEISVLECDMLSTNLQRVVTRGREPGLSLETPEGEIDLKAAGIDALEQIALTATMLDQIHQTSAYSSAVVAQKVKMVDASKTPSAMVLADLFASDTEHSEWLVQKSIEHKNNFLQRKISPTRVAEFDASVADSLLKQADIEANDTLEFDQYLAQYMES